MVASCPLSHFIFIVEHGHGHSHGGHSHGGHEHNHESHDHSHDDIEADKGHSSAGGHLNMRGVSFFYLDCLLSIMYTQPYVHISNVDIFTCLGGCFRKCWSHCVWIDYLVNAL